MKSPFCIAILSLITCAQAQEDAVPDKSHYRLFAATIDVNRSGRAVSRPCLFKIDMRTGSTWRMHSIESTNGIVDYWVEIPHARNATPAELDAALGVQTNTLPDFRTLREVQTSGPAKKTAAEEFLEDKPKAKP